MIKPEFTPDSELDLEGVIKKYYDAVRSNALHATRSENDAADITQNVFTLLVERWDGLERDRIGGWLFAVTRRKIHEHFRAASKDVAVISIDNSGDSSGIDLPMEDKYFALRELDMEAVKQRVLSVLSDAERSLYDAYFTEGRSYEDICSAYTLSYSAASSRIKRIRRKLEQSIKDNSEILPVLSALSVPVIMKIMFNGR
ncbi:MAG: sigma-70 family RNA polymerase sigma factor [Clostridia bacterium]|nr:sigma-70 family RNA polymerase sigma factor [Clostridia bacterium]